MCRELAAKTAEYQFPMGKVKISFGSLVAIADLTAYQFPMGKVKMNSNDLNRALDEAKALYQFPMGKVK